MTDTDKTFTATNGALVTTYATGSAMVTTPTGAQHFFGRDIMVGIKEHLADTFQRESDAARGVHRDPVTPHMVVYDKDLDGRPMTDSCGTRGIRVLNENSGTAVVFYEGNLDWSSSENRRVAERWFAANPATPLPKPGEVWLLDGTPMLVTRWGSLRSSTGALTPFPAVMARTTRIYPQED